MHQEHNGSAALRRSAVNGKLALIKRILPFPHSLFFTAAFLIFCPFKSQQGFIYELGDPPTREKSQKIKEH